MAGKLLFVIGGQGMRGQIFEALMDQLLHFACR